MGETQRINDLTIQPDNLSLEPDRAKGLNIVGDYQRTFTMIHGKNDTGGKAVEATPDGALRAVAYGVDFESYDTVAGTAPAGYGAPDELIVPGRAHRWDFWIEAQEALCRFKQADGSWGNDLVLFVGFTSIPFTSTHVQIMQRGGTAGTYTIAAYW